MAATESVCSARQFMVDSPCPERVNSVQAFPELLSQTYCELIDEMATLMRGLQDNHDLQREFVSLLRKPHRDLLGLSNELHAVQQRLNGDSDEMKENESCFQDLLACLSTQSQDELQALITATESFKELLPVSVDWILSVTSEEISNLFILFKQIPISSSAHTFSSPAPSETDSVYCQLLSRIGFTNWRGHLMYERQLGFCGLDMITLTIAAIQSVTSTPHNHY